MGIRQVSDYEDFYTASKDEDQIQTDHTDIHKKLTEYLYQ